MRHLFLLSLLFAAVLSAAPSVRADDPFPAEWTSDILKNVPELADPSKMMETWLNARAFEALDRAAELAAPLAQTSGDDGWFGQVAKLAKRYGVWVGGSLLEERDGRQYNCFALYRADGTLAGAYRKVHLCRLMQEEQYLAAGEEAVTVATP